MDALERYRHTLQKRISFSLVYIAAVFLLLATGVVHMNRGSNPHVQDFIAGVDVGFCVATMLLIAFYVSKWRAAQQDAEKLRRLYIAETDERSVYIAAQIGGAGMDIILYGLALATLVTGFVNEIAFFSLCGALFFVVSVKFVLKRIYMRKY